MQTVEASGKTVEEAKRKAAEQLGVSEDDIEFEVLEVGTKGVFGLLGGQPARVRATLYESKRQGMASTASPRIGNTFPEEAEEDLPWKSRPKVVGSRGGQRGQQKSGSRQQERQTPPAAKESRTGGRGSARPSKAQATAPSSKSQVSGEAQNRRRQARGGGSARPSKGDSAGKGAQTAPVQDSPAVTPAISKLEGDAATVEARANQTAAIVQRILDAGQYEATARVGTLQDDGFEIEIDGAGASLIVGRGGQVLDALQFVVGVMANRQYEDKVRVSLEANGFRRKHRETLESTALQLAEQVVEHNQEAELEPLPARDRLIIHNILKDHPKVYTYSEGEGDQRHVVISPKNPEDAQG